MTEPSGVLVDSGELAFTIESRLLRELGERLVKQPEVAIVELIKNSYDADATECVIRYDRVDSITVSDNGIGMTFKQFTDGWMRIGTAAKQDTPQSYRYDRRITGEKGIGRFAVRFLGRTLTLVSIAWDTEREVFTRLTANFDWPTFDQHEDLGDIRVPYELETLKGRAEPGTVLTIGALRSQASTLDLARVKTDSIDVLTPLSSLFRQVDPDSRQELDGDDPGFVLQIGDQSGDGELDVGSSILEAYVLRAVLTLDGPRLDLKVFRRGEERPFEHIVDTYESELGFVHADIRFFPRRKGSFAGTGVDGRKAYKWVSRNAGVAVFDRAFRVQPYGSEADDWLQLAADAARNRRDPRSSLAKKHFPMSPSVRGDTAENWMLRLPQPAQLVGLVQVEGRRGAESSDDEYGLIASADREGFVANQAFAELNDLVRGAVEALAEVDRRVQLQEAEQQRARQAESVRQETQDAIDEVRASSTIPAADKRRIIAALTQAQVDAEKAEQGARDRERQLEVMSLLGVVAGFMTHEFGTALQELKTAQSDLKKASSKTPALASLERKLAGHIANLTEFVTYSSSYIRGSKGVPSKRYPVRPRLQQMVRIFGQYAQDRDIEVDVVADRDLMAPLVPVSLYNGLALNLYTNALKAVTSRAGNGARIVAFRSWNDQTTHYLEVSDTGVGIPVTLRERIFDPLFTTTDNHRDPLGSGMGLGLALVRRGVEAFGGRVEIVDPPPTFVTCVRVCLPLEGESDDR